LTTVISSALDYKRFLDRRKQMIQQQVESAQQAPEAGQGDLNREGGNGNGPNTSSGSRDPPTSGHDCSNEPVSNTFGNPVTAGWMPGTVGPVKASHTVTPSLGTGSTDHDKTATDTKSQATNISKHRSSSGLGAAGNCSTTTGTSTGEEASKEEEVGEDSAGLNSARRPASSTTGATQHLLRRLQDQQTRAQTPTRYTQSAGGVTGGDSSDLNLKRNSLPAGGGRQACRSLGQSGEQRWVDRDNSVALDRSNTCPNTAVLEAQTANMEESGDGTGRQKNREPSVDGLLRECGNGDGRVGSGPLSGSSLEDYIIGKQIGQGAYATVFFGLHRESGKKVAIKIYEKYKLLDPQRRKSVRCEIRLMERLRHPNIVIFHDALDTPKQIHIIMDFVGGGSLHHFLKKRPGRRLDDQVAKRLIFQVAQGIKYLHDRHIVHRDIKLENLLLDESNTVKIIDFGFSTIVPPGKKLKIFCGTPSYMAPEIVARKEYAGFCADIWATGVLLYALLCGSFPFRGQNDRDLYRKIVRGVFHVPEVVTDGARNVLSRILTPDMSRRPTIDDVLADQWFSSHRDDLYASTAKGAPTCYQPNTSTSSNATTAAPSSSSGQSAREISRETPQPSVGNRPPSASRVSPAPGPTGNISTSTGTTQGLATNGVLDAWGNNTATSEEGTLAAAGTYGASGSTDLAPRTQKLEEVSERVERADSRCSRQFEEEAISKLERLGYPREEIVRQLKDESSHLCKLYYRFLKALTAWDNKK
jgi:serine/threonine protein kinase